MTENETNKSVPSHQRVEPGSVNIPPFTNFPSTSTSESVDGAKTAQNVIDSFNDALSQRDYTRVADLFISDNGFWRDHLALTWELRTLQGRDQIIDYLGSSTMPITRVEIDTSSASRSAHFGPIDAWGDVKGIGFFIQFETDIGRGEGVVRLAEENGSWRIFTLSTVLTELKGYEEPTKKRRTKGVQHGGNPDRKNWQETREAEANFDHTEPRVLIIGE